MEGEEKDMNEIKVMVFAGNLVALTKSTMSDVVLRDRFSKLNGFTVQQFSYKCERKRDEVGSAYGVDEDVVVDFTIRVMTSDQVLFYEKLKDLGADYYTFVFNGLFENGRLKYYDNAIMVDGFVVDVEECGSNDNSQSLMHVKLLARELTYVQHDGTNISINISSSH